LTPVLLRSMGVPWSLSRGKAGSMGIG